MSPDADAWDTVDSRLTAAGVTAEQVQAAWVQLADRNPTAGFPAYSRDYRNDLQAVLRNMNIRYPNLRVAYLSSRVYGGYNPSSGNAEPFAYQTGFGVKFTIQDQIDGVGNINPDVSAGAVMAPWISWGPYLWSDGVNARGDHLAWLCADFDADGSHVSQTGAGKAGRMLLHHFKTDPTACSWFLEEGCPPPSTAVVGATVSPPSQ